MAVVLFSALERATDQAIELLEEKAYRPGDAFFEAPALAQALNITLPLAQDVLRQLLIAGRVEHSEKGIIVARTKLVRNTWAMSSFSEAMSSRNLSLSSKVISFAIVEAPKAASIMLGLSLGEKVYLLHRVRYVGGWPMVVEVSYLPVARFENLLSYDFAANSLYKILEKDYNVHAANQTLEFLIETPTPEECKLLELDADEALLTLSGKTLDQMGNIFEYSISKSPGRYTSYESSPVLEGLF